MWFDGVSCRAPFVGGRGKYIKAAWMREMELLRLDFFGSLFGGGSDVCVETKEGRVSLRCIQRRKGGGGRGIIGHGAVLLCCCVCGVFMKMLSCR